MQNYTDFIVFAILEKFSDVIAGDDARLRYISKDSTGLAADKTYWNNVKKAHVYIL